MKRILITEEQLAKILREETCKITAKHDKNNFDEFIDGLILTMTIAEIHYNAIERLFHPEEVIK